MIGEIQYFLPIWTQLLIGIAAAIVAMGIIWKKLIEPSAKLIALMDDALPLLRELTVTFKDSPKAFAVLNEIYKQFKTDSGSSLRDAVERLEKAANENKVSAQVLSVNSEAARVLSEQDRAQVARLVVAIDRLYAKQNDTGSTVDRIEAGGKIVASNLDAAQSRADAVQGGEPGEAADAAVKREKP